MGFVAPIIGAIGAFAGSTAGAATIAAAGSIAAAKMAQGPKLPGIQPAPSAPKPGDSLAEAQKMANVRRKTLAATGGKTVYTTPLGATVPQGSIQYKSLLG